MPWKKLSERFGADLETRILSAVAGPADAPDAESVRVARHG
jgi:hypothetical protein